METNTYKVVFFLFRIILLTCLLIFLQRSWWPTDERHERGNKDWQMRSPFMMVVLFLPFGRINRHLMRKKSYIGTNPVA